MCAHLLYVVVRDEVTVVRHELRDRLPVFDARDANPAERQEQGMAGLPRNPSGDALPCRLPQ